MKPVRCSVVDASSRLDFRCYDLRCTRLHKPHKEFFKWGCLVVYNSLKEDWNNLTRAHFSQRCQISSLLMPEYRENPCKHENMLTSHKNEGPITPALLRRMGCEERDVATKPALLQTQTYRLCIFTYLVIEADSSGTASQEHQPVTACFVGNIQSAPSD